MIQSLETTLVGKCSIASGGPIRPVIVFYGIGRPHSPNDKKKHCCGWRRPAHIACILIHGYFVFARSCQLWQITPDRHRLWRGEVSIRTHESETTRPTTRRSIAVVGGGDPHKLHADRFTFVCFSPCAMNCQLWQF